MTIAPRLRQCLDAADADYDLIRHKPTQSAIQNAVACQIPPGQVAKAVLLETPANRLLVVLPSDRRVELSELRGDFGDKPRLASEAAMASIFDDCAPGAVPPLGFGYGVVTLVDDSLEDQPDIYFEGGDHVSLVHMDGQEFSRLVRDVRHGEFSAPWTATE